MQVRMPQWSASKSFNVILTAVILDGRVQIATNASNFQVALSMERAPGPWSANANTVTRVTFATSPSVERGAMKRQAGAQNQENAGAKLAGPAPGAKLAYPTPDAKMGFASTHGSANVPETTWACCAIVPLPIRHPHPTALRARWIPARPVSHSQVRRHLAAESVLKARKWEARYYVLLLIVRVALCLFGWLITFHNALLLIHVYLLPNTMKFAIKCTTMYWISIPQLKKIIT